jgi:hypothetical protein
LYGEHEKVSDTVELWEVDDELRTFLIVESPHDFNLTFFLESGLQGEEPDINILIWYEDEKWKVCFFERTLHRPSQFYASGEDQILVSPAAVEMAGLVITPRQEDFKKISKSDLISIFNQTCRQLTDDE